MRNQTYHGPEDTLSPDMNSQSESLNSDGLDDDDDDEDDEDDEDEEYEGDDDDISSDVVT